LKRISAIEDVGRIRFTSPHPQEVREDFFELLAADPKICRHMHLPLQSGSDRILKAMNRNYRLKRYLHIVEKLRQSIPDLAITTDFIVGFPGETKEDFQATLAVLEQVRFDGSYSFIFSARPGTPAAGLQDDVAQEEKLARLGILQKRQEEISSESLAAWKGRSVEVLLEGPSPSNPECLQGRTSQNFTLNLDEPFKGLQPGMIVPVLVSGRGRFTLKGRYMPGPAAAGMERE